MVKEFPPGAGHSHMQGAAGSHAGCSLSLGACGENTISQVVGVHAIRSRGGSLLCRLPCADAGRLDGAAAVGGPPAVEECVSALGENAAPGPGPWLGQHPSPSPYQLRC